MKAADLYTCMENDFMLSVCTDEWDIEDNGYITENFKARSMGLMTDNTDTISNVYTAVFPSEPVIKSIIESGIKNSLLFVHHPKNWDINKAEAFQCIPVSSLKALKEMKVSIYNLHTPLDRNGEYGTSVNLANALEIEAADEFYSYGGVNVGIIGKTKCGCVQELKKVFERAIGHPVALYNYGSDVIRNNTVGVIAGGGNIEDVYELLNAKGVNTYITGIANARNGYPPSVAAHDKAKANKTSILAGTHYSTEKFACIKMTEYFKKLGLPCAFIPDRPCEEDM